MIGIMIFLGGAIFGCMFAYITAAITYISSGEKDNDESQKHIDKTT